jgi:TonB-dependent starch-binding outer membrane protein SusC
MRILNNGWELDAEYRHNAGGITYSIGGNLTLIKNNVENSPYSIITSGAASGSGLTSATINGYINGQPIGSYLLREYIGLDNNGVSIYNDVDKDGSISDKDRIVAGTALPNRMYSFYGTAAFKGLDLAVNFNGVAGNKVYDNTANSYFYKAKIAKSVNTTKDAFKEPNESINNAAAVSTRFLKNGAYLRLNNVALGYSLNTSAIGLNRWVKSLRLSITGQNLFVITDYDGYDPEVNTDRAVGGFLSYGIDYLSYPKARSIIFALNVSL